MSKNDFIIEAFVNTLYEGSNKQESIRDILYKYKKFEHTIINPKQYCQHEFSKVNSDGETICRHCWQPYS